MNASTTIQPSDLRLGVNVDHVATLRQARGTRYPSVADAARQAMAAGADSITIHLREDRRHIQDADVASLCAAGDVPVNLEMALTDEMVEIALRHKPRDCCLVPESREELTTEGGLDVAGQVERVRQGLDALNGAGINAALFIDPEIEQIDAAARAGARFIEIHTGAYADAPDEGVIGREHERIVKAAEWAGRHGIEVHAGHGLHVDNVGRIAGIAQIVELNIGHALVARAVFVGLAEAVREMRAAMETARRNLH
ncbi:pyridoxine 5'-phosphate synthase [Salinisphaera sp. LB1]|uniref:pyridoxine 5'-phosphate synthase n=1 Tax=Salinisphaera sp. LB1 TaxID=2183911 RepID=UPI000D706BA3|nr:pyridoxine 5'-phosphate synthase [Salinisphaera sp. LB1]AWN16970.1 Pyridoxine 5'-phosphate synthase [Salinisphaera sp. LB1]